MNHPSSIPQRKTIHIILLLLLIVPAAGFGQREKMSALVRKAWLENATTCAKGGKATARGKSITAFVKASSRQAVEGCEVLAEFPHGLYIASVPLNMLGEVAARQEVVRIEAGRPCSATNDTSAVMTRQNLVWDAPRTGYPATASAFATTSEDLRQPKGYTGRGVVVGVMDIGFDLTHPTFLSADGTTLRIKALWDQLDRTEGGIPHIVDGTEAVGRQYVGTEALLSKALSTDGRILCHGTHTAGSAAGSGWNGTMVSPFRGMAPEADICLVANYTTDNLSIIPEEERYKYTSATDVLGFKYLFDYAASVGKPCVASFSEGSRQTLGDDSILMEEALSALLGEGRIIVASAGNEGKYYTHILKPEGRQSAGAFILPSRKPCYTFRSSAPVTLRLTFYPSADAPTVREITTAEILACEDGLLEDTMRIGGTVFPIAAAAFPSAYGDGDTATELLLSRTDGGYVGRDIPVSLTLLGKEARAEAFSLGGYFTTDGLNPSLADADNTCNILLPGAFEDIICVGATNARRGYLNHEGVWYDNGYGEAAWRAPYSSVGPTVSGIVKPDICAPGSFVKSALSGAFIAAGGDIHTCTESFTHDGTTYGWAAFTGTSMSTPLVSGIIATWLEACPTLTPRQVMDILSHTAAPVPTSSSVTASTAHDGFCNSLPYSVLHEKDIMHGYGAIDAYAGLQHILANYATGIIDIPADSSAAASRDHGRQQPSNGRLTDLHGRSVVTPVQGRLYILDGRKKVF
ncbi:MAG: S8 family serine peptidase [Prevotella sp.]|nr:S8 family serine peptidase [Prevotella sp.]